MNANLVLLLITIIEVSYGKPLDSSKDAKILTYENELGENGMYRFSFESSDGTIREESGTLQIKNNEEILIVRGSYSFLDDKGKRHDVTYIADDLGYRTIQKVVAFAGSAVNRIDPSVLGTLVGSGVR